MESRFFHKLPPAGAAPIEERAFLSELTDSINRLEVAERDRRHRRDIVLDSFLKLEQKVELVLSQNKEKHDADVKQLTYALIVTNIILMVVGALAVVF
jgi:uncharacterized protein YggL (DUF469 family)